MSSTEHRSAVAVIGMACRVPGARSVAEFWRNLRAGVESIRPLSREELLDAGLSSTDLANPRHVPAAAILDGQDLFDAGFFGFTAREAELLDPQHRVFLECAWEALEDAGYDPARYDGAIAVFGGGIFDSYVTWNLLPAGVFDDKAGMLQTVLANEKDYMTSRVAYKLNLRGPACNVQTGCSTSLVAIHLASQSLLNFESDIALAGGVAIDVSRKQGYFHHEGSVYSPDGHCRAFDADARGTVFGNGAGIVVLKRLEDAVADGDAIRAIVLGSAMNNDGSLKVGFTAPSVHGQSRVIIEALADAGVKPETIGYVEAHGTGTALGDPIEIQAMAKAFSGDPRRGACGVGSVKTNIGHLDAAAGVSGFMKAVLSLQHRQIPPTLHFRAPNPALQLAATPFHIVSRPTAWESGSAPGVPRRAGVSSFGMGGTNAHVVIEEAPEQTTSPASRPCELLVLSARSGDALEAASMRLAQHLRSTAPDGLADTAHTLQVGRALFSHRRIVVAGDADEAARLLETAGGEPRFTRQHDGQPPRFAFMFPGQGAQYARMGRCLYESEQAFRRAIDACAAALRPDLDLLGVLGSDDADAITRTDHAQPALFAVEYALARLYNEWGVDPEAFVGHSVGEYVAACLAGVFTPETAVRLVFARGRLMQQAPPGAMSAVLRAAAELQVEPFGIEIAAVNAPEVTVVAGPEEAIAEFEALQRASGVECRRLHTSHAFHSAAMDTVVQPFADLVARAHPRRPERRFISNATGTWITDEQATNPAYWARHLRAPVLFAQGIRTLFGEGINCFLEVGPGRTLTNLVRAQRPAASAVPTMPGARENAAEHAMTLQALGQAWLHGADVNWTRFRGGERRRRVPLPTYPFERARHWVAPDKEETERRRARIRAREKNGNLDEWLYARCWKETVPTAPPEPAGEGTSPSWLVFGDDDELSRHVVRSIETLLGTARVVTAVPDDGFSVRGDREYGLAPDRPADYRALLKTIAERHGWPERIVHLWNARPVEAADDALAIRQRSFYSIAHLVAAVADMNVSGACVMKVVTSAIDEVTGDESICPDRAVASGLCIVVSQEHPRIRCQRIDVLPQGSTLSARDAGTLVAELFADRSGAQVAIRGGRRWIPAVERLPRAPADRMPTLRPGGHYVITGGFGTIGLTHAVYLATLAKARLTLIARTPLPPRGEWTPWVEQHGPADPVARRILFIGHLERLGAEVLALTADVADTTHMRAALLEAERRFGPLHGVISAAGTVDDSAFAPLGDLHAFRCEPQFRAKLGGLPALAEALGDRALDFRLVVSSLSSVLGGLGYGAYAAANAYQDAFVTRRNQVGNGWFVINWDVWHPMGAELPASSPLARIAISSSEGGQTIDRLFRMRGLKQILVSTPDLAARLDEATTFDTPADSARPETADTVAAESEADTAETSSLTASERLVTSIWAEVLGIHRVDVHDAFFDLGGSSLTAIQVIGRLEERLGVKVTIEEFIFQTAGQLAALCDARSTEPQEATVDPEPGAGRGGWSKIRGMLRPRAAANDAVRT